MTYGPLFCYKCDVCVKTIMELKKKKEKKSEYTKKSLTIGIDSLSPPLFVSHVECTQQLQNKEPTFLVITEVPQKHVEMQLSQNERKMRSVVKNRLRISSFFD